MWIEVFKGGEQTDSSGNTKVWSDEDLQSIVDTYNNQAEGEEHRAPVVIGHPTDASPAFAWVSKLKLDGGTISAELIDVQPEFEDWVNRGLYRERSIALDENMLLVHLGFLGGVPPAIKGLKPVRFNAAVRTFNMAVSPVTPASPGVNVPPSEPSADMQTVQQALEAQQARAVLYGIRPQEKGNIIKPAAFADLTDDQFADPVNYRWPLATAELLVASKSTIQNWDENYTETEWIVIRSRLFAAAKALGIDLDHWYFKRNHSAKSWAFASSFTISQTPMDQILSGLVDWLRTTYNEETAQQTQAQIDSLKESMITTLQEWVTSTFGEEVGTAFANKVTELSAAPAEPAAADGGGQPTAPAADPSLTASAGQESTKELLQRIEALEADKRRGEFAAYVDGMITEGRLIPANREITIEQLELAHRSDAAGTTQGSVEKTMRFMASMPKVVPTGQFAAGTPTSQFKGRTQAVPPGATLDPESVKRREKVEAFAQKNGLSYTAAFNQLKAQGDL